MFPLLFNIPILGGIPIYTYGVLVALGFMAGISWSVHEAKIAGVNPNRVLDLAFYIILSALVGSRVLYIMTEWQRYLSQPLDVFKIWEGGLIFYGGLIGALLVSYFYMKRHKMPFLRTADFFMPGVALGHTIGRLGCFMAGCCYGGRAPEGSPWGVVFPSNPFSLAPAGVTLYPSQLFESAASLLIFFILVLMRRKGRYQPQNGQIFLAYLILYSVTRSLLEIFRGGGSRNFVIDGWLSVSQLISVGLILMALIIYSRFRRQTETGGRRP